MRHNYLAARTSSTFAALNIIFKMTETAEGAQSRNQPTNCLKIICEFLGKEQRKE